MGRNKSNLVVGLTTFNHEFLNISISGLGRVAKNVTLVIFNDNPCRKLRHRDIRRMGFRGNAHIINTDENIGHMRARIAILRYIEKSKIHADWFMFANDDDIVSNTRVPCVSDDNFAVMGNAIVIKSRLLDVLRVMQNPTDFTVDGVDTVQVAPNVCMAGTFIRTKYLIEYAAFVDSVIDDVLDIITDVPFHIPTDLIMWNGFIEFMRKKYPNMRPIYMNQTNYIMIKINGTRHANADQCTGMVNKFLGFFENI